MTNFKKEIIRLRYKHFSGINDRITRNEVEYRIRQLLEKAVDANEILNDYVVICDERNNPSIVIDRNDFIVGVFFTRKDIVQKREYVEASNSSDWSPSDDWPDSKRKFYRFFVNGKIDGLKSGTPTQENFSF